MRKIATLFFILMGILAVAGSLAEEIEPVFRDDFSSQSLLQDYKINLWERTPGECQIKVVQDSERGGVLYLASKDVMDAFVCQAVSVKPDTYYRVSVQCMAQIDNTRAEGVSIWIGNTYSHTPTIYDTEGRWVPLTLYGRTGSEQYRLGVGLRFGGAASANSGWAMFDDFEMVEVDEVPKDAKILTLSSGNDAEKIPLPDYSNQLANSRFSEGLNGWTRNISDDAAAACTVISTSDQGKAVSLKTTALGWAVLQQTIPCDPGTVYYVSGLCKASGVTEGGMGACITAGTTGATSQHYYETAGEWEPLEFYCKTSDSQTELTIELRLGGQHAMNIGEATFDNISVKRAKNVPSGSLLQSNEPGSSFRHSKTRYAFLYLYIFAAYAALIAFVIRKMIGKDGLKQPVIQASAMKRIVCFLPVFMVAFVLHIKLGYRLNALMGDMVPFQKWADYIYEQGFFRFYQTSSFGGYPPLYIWMLWPIGALRATIPHIGWGLSALLLRSIPILCNLVSLILVYHLACKRFPVRTAVGLAAIVAFEPCLILDSTGFGQVDSLLTLMILICALNAENKRYVQALLWFGLATLVKPQALLFGPVGFIFIVVRVIEDIRENKNLTTLKSVLGGIGVLAVLFYAVGFVCSYLPEQPLVDNLVKPFTWLTGKYSGIMLSFRYQTYNALNLYYLMHMNLVDVSVKPGVLAASYAAMAVVYAYAAFLLIKSRRHGALVLVGGITITLLFIVAPLMHERYGIPALLLLFVAACLLKDLRLIIAAAISSFAYFMNLYVVLHSNYDWTSYFYAAMGCLNAIYIAWLGYDILIRKQREQTRMSKEDSNRSYW